MKSMQHGDLFVYLMLEYSASNGISINKFGTGFHATKQAREIGREKQNSSAYKQNRCIAIRQQILIPLFSTFFSVCLRCFSNVCVTSMYVCVDIDVYTVYCTAYAHSGAH